MDPSRTLVRKSKIVSEYVYGSSRNGSSVCSANDSNAPLTRLKKRTNAAFSIPFGEYLFVTIVEARKTKNMSSIEFADSHDKILSATLSSMFVMQLPPRRPSSGGAIE
jgi:hypothetical protein